jgi:gliding motility-associated-like protein
MKNKSRVLFLSFFALFLFSANIKAQAPFRYLTYIFPSDSISGFDEPTYKQIALQGGYFGSEYHVFMYTVKRNYINEKYGIKNPTTGFLKTGLPNGSNARGPGNVVMGAPCANEDFEASPTGLVTGALTGWQLAEGQNNYLAPGGSCTMNGCCPTFPSNNAWVMATPVTGDPVMGTIPNSPLGGTKVLKMNDDITNRGEVVRIQQTFPVTSSNALFQFAYMGALNGQGHACCSQPYIRITLIDCMNNLIACPQVSITPPGPSCTTAAVAGWTTNVSGYSYTSAWQVRSLDLTPYMGSCVTIQITVGDCDGWAHFGYAYVDCLCLPMTINVNNILFPAGSSAVAVAACGVSTATMTAPPGLGPYTWTGPTGTFTTQTITSTIAGNYTLTMNPVGVCAPITRTVNLTFGTFPAAGFTFTNTCTTYTFTNTGTGPPAVQTYSFVGPGSPTSFTTTASTSVVNFAPSTTYTIIQTVTNASGCPKTYSTTITTPPGPSPAFTASPSFTQCLTGNAFTFNATTSTGTHTYNFNPTVGAPPTGSSANYGPVSFTAPGTYTVTHTVNSGGCVTSTQSVVVVNSTPTASASATAPACSGGVATLTGSGGPGNISWSGPGGFTAFGTPVTINNFTVGNQGTYTMTVNNFGCINTTTVSITLPPQPTVNITNNGPVCAGNTISLTALPSNSTSISFSYWYNSTFSWYNFSSTLTPTIATSNTITTNSSAVFYFYVSWTGGCYVTASTTVQVVTTPTVSASNTGSYCPGATVQLNCPTSSGTYTWSGPGGFTSSVQNPTTIATSSGVYSVMIGSGSCTAIATTSVVVNPLASPTITSNSPVCAGAPLTFSVGSATSYTWSGPGGFTSSVQSPTIASSTATMAGVYSVTIANASGCKSTATINVTVSTPTTTASNTGPYCAGQTITLSTPAATTYTWTGPNAFTSNAQSPTIANSTTVMSGVYTVTSTTGSCKATATTNVIVNALPTPTASNTGPYCPGNTIQLNVGAFTSYTWTGPSAFSSNAQNPTQANAQATNAGAYSITVTDANGCKNTVTTNVIVNPTPTVVVGSNSPVCLNSNINLTASGGTGYSWSGPNAFTSAVQNPTVTNATAVNAGVYTVTVTAAGCTNTGTVNVTVLTPTTSASNTGPFCVGSTIQLNTPAATSYTWSGPSGFTSNAQNPTIANATAAMAGTYSVIVSAGSCTANATTNVVINPLPTPLPSNTGPYCPGNTIQLNVGAFTTYTWSGPSAFTSNSQNPTQANAQTTNGGVYTVSVTDANGCKNTATTNVVVNPTPTVVIGSNSPICLNANINLTASGGTGYSWSGPNAFTSAVQNPTVTNATSINAGVYTVTVTASGCTNTGTVSVTILTPTTSATNGGPFCVGSTIQLNTPSATSYTWSGPGGFTSNAQNPTIANATAAMAGTYSVLVSAGSCTANATTNVVINPLPTPAPSNTGPYCPGNTMQLNVGAFTTYTWSGPSAFTSNSQNPTQANAQTTNGGVYTVSVTDANGCVNSSTTTVVVNPSPVVVIGSNSPICLNSTLNLTSSGGTGYAWSGPSAFTSALQNPTITNATAANAGIYTVTITASGCTNTGTVSVSVLSPTTSASNTGAYCAGQTINLSTPAATTYNWTGPLGFTSTSQNPNIPASTTGMSGVYSVTVAVGTCTASATTNVVVNALPTPAASNTGAYCPGNTISLNVGAFNTYTWTGPSAFTSNAQSPTQANAQTTNGGVYTVAVTDANGCVNTTTTNVVVNPNPVVAIGSNNPVCVNTAINLTSGGGTGYAWSGPNSFSSALQNPTIPNATNLEAGVYTVTVTALGCSSTGTVNVIVSTPTAGASNSGPYCAGATINLTGSTASTFTWSGPGGYSSNSQNASQAGSTPAMSGTYTLIVSIGTCTASATTNVVVNALPTPSITSNSPVCAGQTIYLTGSGATTYTWTGPSSFYSTTPSTAVGTTPLTNPGTYVFALAVTDANGCVNSTTTNVVINGLPVIAVNNPTTCVNTTINLTSNGGSTYSWSGPGGFTSNAQNPNIPLAQLNMSGVYTVTVTSAPGCTNTANANVNVFPLPTPTITSNSPVCSGGSLNLFGSGGTSYAWSGPGYTGPNQNPTLNNVTASANGVYTLLATLGSCTASTTYTVVINPLPVFNFTGSNVTCNGLSNGTSTVNVTVGTGPYNYNWNTTPVQTTQDANGLVAGTYSCTVTDANGCTSVSSTQITQPTQFSVAISSTTLQACANNPINIIANGSGGTGPYTYNWVSGPSTAPYSIIEASAGNYNYVVNAVDAYNCPATANINLTYFAQPTVSATSATLCAGQTGTTLIASGATSYVWQPGNITGSTYPFSGNTSVSVTVVGTSNGCSNSANAVVMVNPNPNASIAVSNITGCVPSCMNFTATGSSNITSYGWMLNGVGITGAQNGGYCFDNAASYTLGLTVMDANGCSGTITPVTIDIYPQPVADFNHAPIKPIVNQDPYVTFTDASWGAPIVSWNWYFMNTAQYTSTQQNPQFMYTDPGTYPVVLVVKSDKGCTDTIIRPVVVGEDFGIYVPNAFTPNADGVNDVFQPKGFGVTQYELNIFDRWGEKVFSTKTFDQGWDGTFQGRGGDVMKEDSYTWLINCTSVFGKSHELKGHVTLLR